MTIYSVKTDGRMEQPVTTVGRDAVIVIHLSSEGAKEDEALTAPFRCPYSDCAFKTVYGLSFARHLERDHKKNGPEGPFLLQGCRF